MSWNVTLSVFADEIARDFDEQLQVLLREGLDHIDFRAAWGSNVLDLSDSQLDEVVRLLHERRVRVACIGSPIGKTPIGGPFEEQLPRFRRALEVAHRLGTTNVRIFSFYLPKGEPPERHRDEVLRRMRALAETARREAPDILLVHENEREIYGETPERCADIVTSVGAANLKSVFDPGNYVIEHVRPFVDAYPRLADSIAYVHVKDARMADGRIVPAGEGDGELLAVFAALKQRGYAGVLALEPHLQLAGRTAGFTGAELFHTAVAALRGLLAEVN